MPNFKMAQTKQIMTAKELCKAIVDYCSENSIHASMNNRCGSKMVSFEVEDRNLYCKECGVKVT